MFSRLGTRRALLAGCLLFVAVTVAGCSGNYSVRPQFFWDSLFHPSPAIVNGLGIAVPSNDAADFVRRGPLPSLGVTLRPVPAGVQILDVDPDGAAALASLKAGDLLLLSLDELYSALDSGQPALRLRFMRGVTSSVRLPVRETVVRLGERALEAA